MTKKEIGTCLQLVSADRLSDNDDVVLREGPCRAVKIDGEMHFEFYDGRGSIPVRYYHDKVYLTGTIYKKKNKK